MHTRDGRTLVARTARDGTRVLALLSARTQRAEWVRPLHAVVGAPRGAALASVFPQADARTAFELRDGTLVVLVPSVRAAVGARYTGPAVAVALDDLDGRTVWRTVLERAPWSVVRHHWAVEDARLVGGTFSLRPLVCAARASVGANVSVAQWRACERRGGAEQHMFVLDAASGAVLEREAWAVEDVG